VKQRRVVSFAGTAVAVEAEGRDALRIGEFLWRDFPVVASAKPVVTFHVAPGGASGTLQLAQGSLILNSQDTPGNIAAHLVCEVARQIAERSDEGLLFHAAAVSFGTSGVLLPGASGAGKTTVSAHLVSQGFQYLTDELSLVPAGEMAVEGFGRPLSLKPGAWPTLERQLRTGLPSPHALETADGFLVRPAHLTDEPPAGRAFLRLIVFPRRQADAAPGFRRLSKAEAALALLAHLVNARNLPNDGLGRVLEMARSVPAFDAVYDDAATIVPMIQAVLAVPVPAV
jgi:hypothetical protein